MMDQHMFQLITGLASANKIGQEFRSETPFTKYDVLTPAEPGWAWQLTKRLLCAGGKLRASHKPQKHLENCQSGVQSLLNNG